MQVHRSRAAGADIDRILEYYEARNPPYADRLAGEFDRAFQQLAVFPFLGVARSNLRMNLRVLIRENHLIFYAVEDDEVTIVRVLHQRQDIQAAFGEPEAPADE